MIAPRLKIRLKPIATSARRLELFRGLTICWLAAAISGGALYALRQSAGWELSWALPLWLGATVAAFFVFWRRARLRAPGYQELARQIEREHPELNAALITAVEQEPAVPGGDWSYLQQRVIEEALDHQRRHLWGHGITERLLFAQCIHWVAAAFFLLSVAGVWLSAPARRGGALAGRGVTVTPGDIQLERGNSLVVFARFDRQLPADVALVIVPRNGSARRVELVKNLEDPVWGGTIGDVSEEFDYRVEYDGRQTREYKVGVFEHPALVRADARIAFPAYTGLGEKKVEETRRVSAVEGSTVTWTLRLNKPIVSGQLTGPEGVRLPLVADPQQSNTHQVTFVVEQNQRLELELEDSDGRTNKMPAQFEVAALKNRAPELKLTFPRGDQRVSALEEMTFTGETWDDFGVRTYGIAYQMVGKPQQFIELGKGVPTREKREVKHLLALESLEVEPDDLVSYFLWADDIGPDGEPRRTFGEMFFAEVRPFEEIFREGDSSEGESPSGEQPEGSPTEKLAELQKEIVNATWNLQRREAAAKPSAQYRQDIGVVQQSQQHALEQTGDLRDRASDPRVERLVTLAETEMKKALEQLTRATDRNSVEPLPPALTAEQGAYQALLKLQAHEYQVSRNQRGQSSGSRRGQRAQRQLDQLELKQSEDRYETQRQAARLQSGEQREQLEILSKLKQLAQRQQDLNERLKELQASLQEARSEAEREAIRRQLKRLREEEQRMLADLDELRQQMARNESPQMSEPLQQLDQTRAEVRRAAEELEREAVSQALAAGTRAQRELQELREDFRKQTSSQFAEEMRELRQEARQLVQTQEEAARQLEEMTETTRKTLSDSGERKELETKLQEQKQSFTNLLQSVRQVTEQSEASEPLLSKQLYDTMRRIDRDKVSNNLDLTTELVRRGFLQQAELVEPQARAPMEELKRGVERAAESVLGDETEALRLARKELDDLTQQLENEIRGADPESARGTGATNQVGRLAQNSQRPTDRSSDSREAAQPGAQREQQGQPGQPGEQGGPGQRQGEQAQRGQQGQPGQEGRQGQGQQGQEGQQGQGGQSRTAQSSNQPNQEQPGGQGGGGSGPQRIFFDQRGGSPAGGPEGPITGGEYARWLERLGDVEGMLDLPELRAELARVRERVQGVRGEFRRHGTEPRWDLVRTQIAGPLVEVRDRIAEELLRRESSHSLVPIDRDPVPPQYSERVRRYYEQLSSGRAAD